MVGAPKKRGAWHGHKKGASMALDINTFLIVMAAAIVGIGFAVWIMYKKVS